MRLHGLLYDFDHTLVDSPLDFAAMRQGVYELLDTAGIEVPERAAKLILEVVEEAVNGLPATAGQALRAAAEAHILEVELTAARAARAIDGVVDSLHLLRAEGRQVGIITRNCRQVIETVLQRAPLPYDVLLCRDDVARVKPAPEHAWAALAALGVQVDQAALIGDFRADMACAVAAGLLPLGVTTGSQDAAALRAAGAFDVLDTAAALPQWLAERGW